MAGRLALDEKVEVRILLSQQSQKTARSWHAVDFLKFILLLLVRDRFFRGQPYH